MTMRRRRRSRSHRSLNAHCQSNRSSGRPLRNHRIYRSSRCRTSNLSNTRRRRPIARCRQSPRSLSTGRPTRRRLLLDPLRLPSTRRRSTRRRSTLPVTRSPPTYRGRPHKPRRNRSSSSPAPLPIRRIASLTRRLNIGAHIPPVMAIRCSQPGIRGGSRRPYPHASRSVKAHVRHGPLKSGPLHP
jgi:hypothetical protein